MRLGSSCMRLGSLLVQLRQLGAKTEPVRVSTPFEWDELSHDEKASILRFHNQSANSRWDELPDHVQEMILAKAGRLREEEDVEAGSATQRQVDDQSEEDDVEAGAAIRQRARRTEQIRRQRQSEAHYLRQQRFIPRRVDDEHYDYGDDADDVIDDADFIHGTHSNARGRPVQLRDERHEDARQRPLYYEEGPAARYNEFASLPSPHNSDEDEEADYESVSNLRLQRLMAQRRRPVHDEESPGPTAQRRRRQYDEEVPRNLHRR
jgi:hypothetical protein